MQRLYFVRHGLSEGNKASKWSGLTNSPLAPEGHAQAKKAGEKAKEQGLSFDLIVSSPLDRAHITAKHIASQLDYPHEKIKLSELVLERAYGELENRHHPVAAAKYATLGEASIDDYEGVEKLADMQKRADAALQYLKSLPHETILIVGHGAIGRAITRSVKKQPMNIKDVRYKNAEIIQLI